jgi:hypothetical protein
VTSCSASVNSKDEAASEDHASFKGVDIDIRVNVTEL